MANDLSAFSPEYWSKRMQVVFHKTDVFRAISNFEERATLKDGDTTHRPYRSALKVQTLVKTTDVSFQDVSGIDETLVVATADTVPFFVSDLDKLQNKWDLTNEYADDAGKLLSNEVDASVLSEYASAAKYLDAADIGGTAGEGITANINNIYKLFSAAKKKLSRQNVPTDNNLFAVLSPDMITILDDYMTARDTPMGDEANRNGFKGKFRGFDVYESNSLTATARLTLGTTDATAANTISIEGVTFTFVASIGVTAGNVLMGTSAAATIDNLVLLINAPGTTTATGVALSAADQATLRGVSATDGTTYLAIKAVGKSYLTLTATITGLTAPWTAIHQLQHNLFGRKGAIDVVVQKEPNVLFTQPDRPGRNVIPWQLYGKKTFVEGTKQLVDVRVRTDAIV